MNLKNQITNAVLKAIKEVFDKEIESSKINLQTTKPEFEGTFTFVIFPFIKELGGNPMDIGTKIGDYLKNNNESIADYNVVKGFLNLVISSMEWVNQFDIISKTAHYGFADSTGKNIMVEYSSPNTNKPLHLGHLRNNFLGYSVAEILKAAGHNVIKTQIINDRGIHICKSMLAWQKFGNGETPQSSGLKGDKLAGKYYVKFDQIYKEEINQLITTGKSKEEAEKEAPILKEAQEMLLKWEQNDPEIRALWEKMNGWVYDGFNQTYQTLGVDFDKLYYESDTFLIGKDYVLEGLKKGVFFQKDDGSIWVDLINDDLDEKLLLRSDGTSVYMTQDIGTAILRFEDFPTLNGQVYTVGNEQEYHFKVLFLILQKLGFDWAKNCYHLSYGMVDLPSGKMKSREGTVVDADDLVQEMIDTAKNRTEELGKIDGFSKEEANKLYHTLALGAIKYFLLKVDPKKRMLFNPEESIEFNGNTGPFIQYTFARISAILRKASMLNNAQHLDINSLSLHVTEIELLALLIKFPETIQDAASAYEPSIIANFVYDLAKSYNKFYAEVSIFNEENENLKQFRIELSKIVANTIASSMKLLGIEVPERM